MVTNHYSHLKDKWSKKHESLKTTLWQKHKNSLDWISKNFSPKHLAMGSLASLFLLASPGTHKLPDPHLLADASQPVQEIDKSVFVVSDLANVLPSEVRPLTTDEEKNATDILTRDFGIKVMAEMSGIRLNTSYGYIGQEQHLARYPGDTIASHFDSQDDANAYASYGMAPGLGAYGYFAPSKAEFTTEDAMREKYYIAVQTFLAPGFLDHTKQYNDFFKFRKMLVVNPNNGRAIVAVIGDAGPAGWTGKQLGGSPEVMNYLQRVDGSMKGPVLYFFIEDPENKIPLGPVTMQ